MIIKLESTNLEDNNNRSLGEAAISETKYIGEINVENVQKSESKIYKIIRILKLIIEVPINIIDLFHISITKIYDLIIPIEKSLTISLIVLAILTFIQTRGVIFLIEKLSFYTNLSTSFLGMTLVSWGNNVGDTINACIAVKLGKTELLITSILGTQIINLQFCLGLPWLISSLTSPGLQIVILDSNIYTLFASVFLLFS